uniref:Small ribosomal subunit protein mS29 n=1 Tax=Acrobeloides nanus TaxID=290746 RepID=A0A914C6E3_9BILA
MRTHLIKPTIFLAVRNYESTSSSFIIKRFITRTSTDDPRRLIPSDIGKMYVVPKATLYGLQLHKIFPQTFKQQLEMFEECVWLCRQPTLEIMNCLKAVNTTIPSIRMVVWGKHGTGKSISFYQGVQYAWHSKFVLLTVRNAMDLARTVKDIQMSVYKEGRIDTPYHAQNLLTLFKHQNQLLWDELSKLTTERTYVWTKLEKTTEGAPLTELVELGLEKTTLATDCLGALCRELRRHSTKGDIKLLLAVDMANSLYGITKINKITGRRAPSDEISVIHFIRKFFTTEWYNGACLLVADKRERSHFADKFTIPLDTPHELFGEKGIADLDPFIPIETKNYTEDEFEQIYEYYKEKHWLANPKALTEEGKIQLKYLSVYNPFEFERLCSFN